MLLCSRRPFHHRKREVTIDKIMAGDYGRLEGGPWKRISEEARNFVRRLLVVDPKERMTATQGLEHPWLDESLHAKPHDDAAVNESEKETKLAVGASLKNYKNELELKKIALNVWQMKLLSKLHPVVPIATAQIFYSCHIVHALSSPLLLLLHSLLLIIPPVRRLWS